MEGWIEGGREREGGGGEEIDEMSRMRGQNVISQSSGVMIQRRYLQPLSVLSASPL